MFHQLHFSIGPVQSFVTAARRTRDLWAGSWLLSHLAKEAVTAISNTSGVTLILPKAATMGAVDQRRLSPIAGTPNRFLAEGNEAVLKVAAGTAGAAVQSRWKHICEAVWSKFVKHASELGAKDEQGASKTALIWERQVQHFWEITWVIGPNDHGRKAWRDIAADVEEGYRCALFPHLQELSGYVGAGKNKNLTAFWNNIRSTNGVGDYDLDESEVLSAIGLVKRLYPCLEEFKNKKLDVTSWPSTAWVAALPWIRQTKDTLEAAAYIETLKTILGDHIFDSTAAAKTALGAAANTFSCLDGQLMFDRGIETECLELGPDKKYHLNRGKHQTLLNSYKEVVKQVNGKPAPWFAALVMDGDQMGKLLATLDESDRSKISVALGTFANQVDAVVEKYDGRTVYAGGDDVLVLLPAVKAIECAQDLRNKYIDSFENQLGKNHVGLNWVGISAGLVFADWKTPLRQVLREAHYLLDAVAKELTGRDALAISVWLSSGKACQWSAPWKSIGDENDGLLADLQRCGNSEDVSASFVYGVSNSLVGLFDPPRDGPTEFANLPDGLELEKMLLADLVRIRGDDKKEDHKKTAAALTRLSQPHLRTFNPVNGAPLFPVDAKGFSFDGLRLARFLVRLREGDGA